MKYEYMVKFGDTFYPAGTEVPDDEPVKVETKVEEPIEQATSEIEQKADDKRKGGRPRKKA